MASPPKPKPRKQLNGAKENLRARKLEIPKSSFSGQPEKGKDSSSANSDTSSQPTGKIDERVRNQTNDSGSEFTVKQLFLKPEAEYANYELNDNSTENTEETVDRAPALPPKLSILRSKKTIGNDIANKDHYDDDDTSAPELPPKPLFLRVEIGEKSDPIYRNSTNNSPPPPLPPRNPTKKKEVDSEKAKAIHFDSTAVAYKIVDVVSDWKRISDQCSSSVVQDNGDHRRVIQSNRNDQRVSDECDEYDDVREGRTEMHQYDEIESLPIEMRPPLAGEVIAKNNSKPKETGFQTSRTETEQHVLLTRHAKRGERGWITGHRADDFVDFEDIKLFLELKKNLQSASAKIADLERTVAVAKKNPVTLTQQSKEIYEKKGTIAKDEGVTRQSTVRRLSGGAASRQTFHDNCTSTAKIRENSERECKHKPKGRAAKRTLSAPEDISCRNCTSEQDIFYANSKPYDEKPSQMSEYEAMEAYKSSFGKHYVNARGGETAEHPAGDVEREEQRYTQGTLVDDERSLQLHETGATGRQEIRGSDLDSDVILRRSSFLHNSQSLFPVEEIYSNQQCGILDREEPPPSLPPKALAHIPSSHDYKELL